MQIETCKVCDKNSSIFHNCDICRLYCCRDCYISHVGSCKYIKDEKVSTCKFHQEQIEKYCFNCGQLVCYKCYERGHPKHTILQLGEATSNIKLGIPNTETELAEKNVMCLQKLDTYRRMQHDYTDIVRKVKEEETKWTSLISDISRSLVKPLNTNIELIETKCEGVEYTCGMIKDTKNQFRDLEIEKFPLTFLFKWSNAMKFKDKIDERSKVNAINKQILERSELEKGKDVAKAFQNLVLNVPKMEGSPAEKMMDRITAQFSEFNLKEPPSQTMSGRQFQDGENYCKDTPRNERYLKEQRCKEISKLSCVADEKLTEHNAAIMDLGDPNRPMRIGVKFGELYDSEWTNAMENISSVKKYYPDMIETEIQEIIIRHLHRLLKKEEITRLPVCKEAAVLRRASSAGFAKHLFQNQVLCKNIIADWDYINKNENVMQIFTQSMFFKKCVYLCWCMVIQDPVLHLDDDQVLNTQIDKNTYEEFEKSGDSAAYIVWPALFLHKGGPLLCKGVVKAYPKKDYEK
ncbi:Hypothetical predicted protein [Mytilus galloprovincialis]|uniref:B box-type domain-containing protein n=1 Tax=Mytilus galloprovincialis TaxID=29158 RepID=A0A8B6G2G2_MYTGA|nr:Hypothetical predicted protein [Mytilus galloprovincialis]